MEVKGQLHASTILPPGKEPLVPIGQETGVPQSRSEHSGGEEKNSQPVPELEPPTIHPVAQRFYH
jgi:hypothetical protein